MLFVGLGPRERFVEAWKQVLNDNKENWPMGFWYVMRAMPKPLNQQIRTYCLAQYPTLREALLMLQTLRCQELTGCIIED